MRVLQRHSPRHAAADGDEAYQDEGNGASVHGCQSLAMVPRTSFAPTTSHQDQTQARQCSSQGRGRSQGSGQPRGAPIPVEWWACARLRPATADLGRCQQACRGASNRGTERSCEHLQDATARSASPMCLAARLRPRGDSQRCFGPRSPALQILSPRPLRRKRRSNKGNARPRGAVAHQVPSAFSVEKADGAPQIACGRVHIALGDGQRAVAREHAHGFDRGASPDKLAQKCVPLIPRAE